MRDWKKYKLRDFLIRVKDGFVIDDLSYYNRVTIRTKGLGIRVRDKAQGLEIGTKKQFFVNTNQFLLSKIDAMNGAFGIVPEECEGAIVTGNFWTYNFDKSIIRKTFLELMCIKQVFTEFSIKASEGSTNRKYLDEEAFLNLEILLPTLPVQDEIVSTASFISQKINDIKTLEFYQNADLKNLLYSKYIDLTTNCPTEKMSVVAPITRRRVEVEADQEYKELAVRSFGKGTFVKPPFRGIDLTWQKPYWVKDGDLLFSNIKAWEGSIAIVHPEEEDWVVSHRYITCLPDEKKIAPQFLLYYLLSPEGLEQVNLASPGSADRNRTLSLRKLEKIEIPLPPIEKQREFENLLEKTGQMKAYMKASQKELEDLFPALLDKVFKSELI